MTVDDDFPYLDDEPARGLTSQELVEAELRLFGDHRRDVDMDDSCDFADDRRDLWKDGD